MIVLPFSSRVLGALASEQLRKGRVSQTLRSKTEVMKLALGETEVILDGDLLYRGNISEITGPFVLSSMNVNDAALGGFQSLLDLTMALKRAGFRFKSFSEYNVFKVSFKELF